MVWLPVLVTVLLAAVVGALIVVQDQRQADAVVEADRVAEAFLSDVGMFRGDVSRELSAARDAGPAALGRVLAAAVDDPPRLGEVPADGADRSDQYAVAVQTRDTFLQPYDDLRRVLRRADVSARFVEAARDALGLRASTFVGAGPLSSSSTLRSRLIPAFVAARDDFAAVRVPTGQDALAGTVRGALQYVIDRATMLADSIDANRSFSFTYADQFQAAATAVDDYETTVEGDVTEAINGVTSTS